MTELSDAQLDELMDDLVGPLDNWRENQILSATRADSPYALAARRAEIRAEVRAILRRQHYEVTPLPRTSTRVDL